MGAAIAAGLGSGAPPYMAFLALAMMIVGLGFKVSAAPFHLWTPDVYQGAPAPVVGLMSTAPKAAAFAVLLRITFSGFPLMQHRWSVLLWVLAALSMTIGNLGALMQKDVKRMLAYSSVAHAGYVLVALAAPSWLNNRWGGSTVSLGDPDLQVIVPRDIPLSKGRRPTADDWADAENEAIRQDDVFIRIE